MYILIVTGLSGAGKSQVLGILEDMGFVCADNIPCQLAKQYIELCSSSENNIERVALVIDSRESVFGYNPLNTYDELRRLECPYEIMFLECEDSVLVRRYSETRRRHPMNDDTETVKCLFLMNWDCCWDIRQRTSGALWGSEIKSVFTQAIGRSTRSRRKRSHCFQNTTERWI